MVKLTAVSSEQDELFKRLLEEPHAFEQEEFERLVERFRSRMTFDEVMSVMASRIRQRSYADQLERNTLLAIVEGRSEESERLLDVLERKSRLGLSLVSPEPKPPPQSS